MRQYYHEMLATTTDERITFPPFQLDLSAGRLSCGSKPVDLPPKAFGVLRYLAERPGQLVSKEELLQGIWPDVHVSADVLKVTIAEIRRVLVGPVQRTAHHRDGPSPRVSLHRADREVRARPSTETGIPPTRYARSGDVNIAYQVLGDGPLDLVFVMGWVSHLEYFWTEPSFARFLRRLASFSRLILFDKRGTGLSDRVPVDGLPTLEQRMDDVRAVMDAVGSKRAALCGVSEGGAMAALFAATYPERTAALVMIGSYAKRIRDASYPWGPTEAQREEFLAEISRAMGRTGGTRGACSLHGRQSRIPPLVGGLPENLRQSGRRRRADPHELRGRHSEHPARHPRSDPGGAPYGRPVPAGGGRPVHREPDSGRALCRTARE